MKSRLAITMILTLGIVMSLGGVGLAVSGLGDSGDSGDAQYSTSDSSTETFGGDTSETEDSGGGESDTSAVDPAGQEAAGEGGEGDELAFTGFAAIPVLIGGVALLGSGFVLRRRADREDG